jgi:hypothetical protein
MIIIVILMVHPSFLECIQCFSAPPEGFVSNNDALVEAVEAVGAG